MISDQRDIRRRFRVLSHAEMNGTVVNQGPVHRPDQSSDRNPQMTAKSPVRSSPLGRMIPSMRNASCPKTEPRSDFGQENPS